MTLIRCLAIRMIALMRLLIRALVAGGYVTLLRVLATTTRYCHIIAVYGTVVVWRREGHSIGGVTAARVYYYAMPLS